MLTATVTVNLNHESANPIDLDLDRRDRHALQYLPDVPDGAHLIVVVGGRTCLTHSAVTWLVPHTDRLDVEIDASDPWAARRWYDAIKSGEIL